MDKVRVGVVGVGALGQHHARVYASLPDAILAAGDFSAIGVIQTLKKANVKIPDEIAVVGFANEMFDVFIEPELTSVDLDSLQIGETTAEILIEQLNQSPEEREEKHIKFPPKLMVRASSIKKEISK